MRFFDTARAYTDSEEKVGAAFEGMRDKVFISTKTMAKTPEQFWEQLDTSLSLLKTDYIDIYQFHCVKQCYRPGDGTGMYECMLEAKARGKIRHIGVTAHLLDVAMELVESGLYETIQFPFSYLSAEKDIEVVKASEEAGMGFICMKGLAGGLITNAAAAMAFVSQFPNAVPIWGIQRESELKEWLSFMDSPAEMTPELTEIIEADRKELAGDFCRGCGYCMPCPAGIQINQCARMSQMIRRAPSAAWLSPEWQEEMKKTEQCLHCGACAKKCPYGLNTPELIKKNYEDYKKILSGEITV